jgi:group I intron endonuclease
MEVYSIYKATNKVNGKCYIGFTNNLKRRQKKHLNDSFNKNTTDYNGPFHRSIRKYGKENFNWEIIFQSLDGDYVLNTMESYFISQYHSFVGDSFCNGYNLTKGGEGNLGCIFSEERKKNISKALTGRKLSEEHRRKNSECRKGRKNSPESIEKTRQANLGRPKSLETRKKISIAKKGKPCKEETKIKISNTQKGISFEERHGKEKAKEIGEKISLALIGREVTEETKEKISKANTGKKRDEVAKAKMSAWQLGLTRSPCSNGTKEKIAEANSKKYIVIFPDGHEEIVFNLSKFCREHNLNQGHLSSVATGKRNSHKGFKAILLEDIQAKCLI